MPGIKKLKKERPRRLRGFKLGEGVHSVSSMRAELQDMTDVLLGREDPPIDVGVGTLMEVADAYFARASEMEMEIHAAEREGRVVRGSPHYKFRTGELRTFQEMAKRAADLGSRRITIQQLEVDKSRTGRESW